MRSPASCKVRPPRSWLRAGLGGGPSAIPARMRWALLVVVALIVLADWAQPLVWPWEPRFVAAIAGGLLYAVAGGAIYAEKRAALWLVALMPVVPLGTLGLSGAGVATLVEPSVPMVGIAGLQVVAAVLAVGLLRR